MKYRKRVIMNLNKTLIALSCIFFLMVLATIININYSKNSQTENEAIDTEMLMENINCIPEIIRSYERVKNVYGKKNILFFRYVNNMCSSCLESQLDETLTLQNEIGKDHVWIFPAYPNDRNSKILLSNELAKYNYRNISIDSLLIPTYDGEQKSYYAWINNEGEIDMVFIPDRNNVRYTRNYFLEVKRVIQKIRD